MKRLFALVAFCAIMLFNSSCSNEDDNSSQNLSSKLSQGLRNSLLQSYDTNGNGVLEDAELLAITDLQLYNVDIESYQGIDVLSNMTSLSMTMVNSPCELDLSANPNLEYISASDVDITGIKFGNNTKLNSVRLFRTAVATLDVSGCPNLTFIDCAGSKVLAHVDARNLGKLETLTLTDCPVKNLNIANCLGLYDLSVGYRFDISSQGTQRERMYGGYVANGVINISSWDLEKLDISNLPITELRIRNCSDRGTNTVHYNDGVLKELNISGCKELEYFDCRQNQLTVLDVSDSPSLNTLYCSSNPVLTALWLKTGQAVNYIDKDDVTAIKYK